MGMAKGTPHPPNALLRNVVAIVNLPALRQAGHTLDDDGYDSVGTGQCPHCGKEFLIDNDIPVKAALT